MQKSIFYDGEIFSNAEARIRAVSSAALYGKGIFTTVAVFDKKPFLWEKHWCRLNANAAKIGINLSKIAEETITDALAELLKKNDLKNARSRITFFDESASKIWSSAAENKTSLLIQIADFRPAKKSYALAASPFPVNSASPLAGVKSCSYLENILAFEQAKSGNFDEAVRVNERGEIVSACLANIFWVKDEKLYTPSLETGCLAGTTRELVLENTKVIETKENLAVLQKAEAIFLASAGVGIVPVESFRAHHFVISPPEKRFKIHSEIVAKTFGAIVSSISPYSRTSPV